jgi:hypothetical protein
MDPHRASGVPRPRHGPRTTPSRAAAHYLREALQRGAPAPKPRARTTRRATTFKSTEPGAKRERTPRPARWAHPRVLPKGCLNLSIADWLIASPFNRRPRSYRAERGNVLAACPSRIGEADPTGHESEHRSHGESPIVRWHPSGIFVVQIPRRSCTTCTTARRDFGISACAFSALIAIRRYPRGQAPPPALRRPRLPSARARVLIARQSIHLGDGVLEHSWVG